MTRWLIRTLVSVTVAAILLRIIPFNAVVGAIRRVSPWAWAASLGVFFVGHYVNAMKLRLILGWESIAASPCVQAQYAGLVANLGLPGLAGGDLVRAAYLVPTLGAKRVALASLVDRMIDTFTVVMLIAIGLPLAGVPPRIAPIVERSGWWIGGGAVAGLIVIGGLVWLRPHERIARLIDQAWFELRARRASLAGAALMSLGVQSAFVMTNVWLAQQVGVTTGIAAWFVAWPLSKLVAILPISLGGIGVREAVLVSLLAPYGAPREAVLASGILWQGVLAASGLAGLIATQVLRRTSSAAAIASLERRS